MTAQMSGQSYSTSFRLPDETLTQLRELSDRRA
jgi:predicted DNA-binding protein